MKNKYNDKIFYKIIRIIICPIFKLIYRPIIINKNVIPTNTKIILAGNHTSILDPILLMCTTKRHIHFLAKSELFKGIKKPIFNNLGLISVNRKIKDKNVLANASKYLENNKVIGIFPEGTTEKNNYPNLLPFKIGTIKLATDTNTKIIPFKIIGKYNIFKRVKIIFGNEFIITNNIDKDNERLYNIIDSMKG